MPVLIALVALVATTFYVTPEASSEPYLADRSTSYEHLNAVIARARYAGFLRTGDRLGIESASALEQAEDHVIRAQGMGIVRRLRATRSMRAKTGFFFSIVTEPANEGSAVARSIPRS